LDLKIVDCHVHFEDVEHADLILSILKELRFKRMNIVSAVSSFRVNFNPEAIYVKTVRPELFYAFGGLDYSSVSLGLGKAEPSLTKQVDTMIQVGFDGVKMVEGKQTERKRLNIAFDSRFYKEYFEYLESLQYPLLFHVNDPEEYWDLEQIPPWAIQKGWFYDKTFPTREHLYNEVGNVLENCPNLKVLFAHFYFLSAEMERASRLLDTYKSVHLDLTPDPVMYYNFSAKPEEWREFFIRYQDRLVYGTDINDNHTFEHAVNLANRVRKLLETDEPVTWGAYPKKKEPLIGLKLPEHVLRKIYAENFEKIVGKERRTINVDTALAECNRLTKQLDRLGMEKEAGFPERMKRSERLRKSAYRVVDILKNIR